MKSKRIDLLNISEYAYLIILSIYLFIYLESENTTFHIPWPEETTMILLGITDVISIARFIVYHADNRRYFLRNLIVVIITTIALCGYFFTSTASFYDTLLFVAVFSIGAIGIDFKKICRCYLLVIGSVFIVTVISCLCGSITDISYWYVRTNGNVIRSSMGTVHPTECGAIIFFLILVAYIFFEKWPGWFFSVAGVAGGIFCWYFCNARNDTGCLLLFSIISFLLYLFHGFCDEAKNGSKVCKVLAYVVSFAAPIVAVFQTVLTVTYHKIFETPFLARLFSSIEDRIRFAAQAYESNGIRLFGTQFDLFTISGNTNIYETGYNMIDFSYVRILLLFGPIALLLILFGMVYVSIVATRKKQYRIVLAIMLVSVHSMMDYNLAELSKNIFLLLPYCVLERGITVETEMKTGEMPWKKILACSVLPFIGIVFGNQIVSYLRTFFQMKGLTGGKIPSLISGLIIAVILLLIVLIDFGICRIIDSQKNGIIIVASSIVVFSVGIICIIHSVNDLNPSDPVYREIQSDEECVSLLKTVNEGNLYFSEYPYLYQKYYGVGESTYLDVENLARLQNATVVVDKNNDCDSYFGRGYLYAPISEYHALYTNNSKVIELLQNKGYELTDYAQINEIIENDYMAEINGLSMDEEGSILVLKGKEIENGPYIETRHGTYILTYELALDKDSPLDQTQDRVATIKVTGSDGEVEVDETEVYVWNFDEKGKASIELTFNLMNQENVEFKLVNISPDLIKVNCIKYRKISSEYDE